MNNTILVPLDGSAIARQILPYVQKLASVLSAQIHLLRVLSDADREHMLTSPSTVLYEMGNVVGTAQEHKQAVWAMMRDHAQGYLESQAEPLRHAGFDVAIDVRIGSPADAIVRFAEHHPTTLIAMATHGYSGLRRWTLGSVTDKVVRATTTPVFIVRGTEPEPLVTPTFKRIMVPLDGSTLARQALPCAIELATCAHAELLLLRAIPPLVLENYSFGPLGGQPMPLYTDEARTEMHNQALQEMDAVAGELRHYDLPIISHVVNGYPAEVIVDEAEQHHIDLIVMATHGYSGIQRWALGSVADKVLHATKTPLVLIHSREVDS